MLHDKPQIFLCNVGRLISLHGHYDVHVELEHLYDIEILNINENEKRGKQLTLEEDFSHIGARVVAA